LFNLGAEHGLLKVKPQQINSGYRDRTNIAKDLNRLAKALSTIGLRLPTEPDASATGWPVKERRAGTSDGNLGASKPSSSPVVPIAAPAAAKKDVATDKTSSSPYQPVTTQRRKQSPELR
jgi:hypothetical protein